MSRLGTLTEVSPKGPDEFESVWGVTVGGIDVDAFEASWSATNFGVGLRASSSISKIDAGAVAFGGVVEVVDVVVAVVRVAVLESNGKLKPDQWFRQHPNVQPGYLKLE